MATCNLNVIVVLVFISRDLYLLSAIYFSPRNSKYIPTHEAEIRP